MLQTFRASAPPSTHFRTATCEEINCSKYLIGWRTIPPTDEAANWIRQNPYNLRFTESRDEDGNSLFRFPPGQMCFDGRAGLHRISLERPSIFTVSNGLGFSRREPAQWVDEMGEQLHKLKG